MLYLPKQAFFLQKLFFFIFCFSSYCVAQNTFIPDNNFEQALINLGYDTSPLDNFVPTSNIKNVQDLDISELNIEDLTGIEDFVNLLNLNCADNQLLSLDISKNTSLKQLFCHGNLLSNLDVSIHTDLEILWCYDNALSNLDVTNNLKLISLVCQDNNLNNIDVSQNTNLIVFSCERNQIRVLDVSNNLKLTRLQCRENILTSLDTNNNINLTDLGCGSNQITTLDLSFNKNLGALICENNQLISLDLSLNPSLTNLDCSNNILCRLNVRNGNNDNIAFMNFTSNTDLNCVVVDDVNGNRLLWEPNDFTNYVEFEDQCGNFITVDELDDVVGKTYTLPVLNNGDYFTETGGNGFQYNSGDIITTTQTIYIFNEVGCDSNESSFFVQISEEDYIIPKYFTPNNDGNHDFWKVIDNSNVIKHVSIYNRNGKLIKFLTKDTTQGWDGTFNGQFLPSDTYWYEITFNNTETKRGYFALKR